MIPEEHETHIIQASLSFISAVTEAYGADEGMKLWENINHNLDPDIKGKVFFAMLTGEYRNTIKLTGTYDSRDLVRAIKCVRTYTGLGLKEAKDLVVRLDQGIAQTIEVDPKVRHEAIVELRNSGLYL